MMAFPANFSYWPFAAVMFVSRDRRRPVRLAQHRLDHELGPGPAPRGGLGHAGDVPQRRDAALDGALLHPAGPRPQRQGALGDVPRPGRPRDHPPPPPPALPRAPLGYIFAAFLGINPLKSLLGPKVLSHLRRRRRPTSPAAPSSPSSSARLHGQPARSSSRFAVAMSLVAAIASALRGSKYVHVDEESIAQKAGLHHQGHGFRIHHDGDGSAAPALLDNAAEPDRPHPRPRNWSGRPSPGARWPLGETRER